MWVRERLGAERVSERRACQVLGQFDRPSEGKGKFPMMKPDRWPGWWSWLRNTGVMATGGSRRYFMGKGGR